MTEPHDPIADPNLPFIVAYNPEEPDPTPPDARVGQYDNVEVKAAETPHFSEKAE